MKSKRTSWLLACLTRIFLYGRVRSWGLAAAEVEPIFYTPPRTRGAAGPVP